MGNENTLSKKQKQILDSALASDRKYALDILIWWCLPLGIGTNPFLGATITTTDADITSFVFDVARPFCGGFGKIHLIPLILRHSYEHGYFEETLRINKALREMELPELSFGET
jgi:hypothetical protein